MRIALLWGGLLVVGLSAPAYAQSLFERCEKEKADIASMKNQAVGMDGEIGAIDQKIEKIRRRLQEFEARRAAKQREKGELLQNIARREAELNRTCSPLRECEKMEQEIERLKQRQAGVANTLRAIQNDIRDRNTEVNRLNGEVDRIENSYRQLNCDNLVPGQTDQATIDRCSALFSDWNRLQTDINRLSNSLRDLRNRYNQVASQLAGISAEIARLLARMRGPCGHSPRLAELEAMERDSNAFGSIRTDLDDMDRKVLRFKGLKVIQPKMRPMIRPADDKDKKPKIRPH
ncbi:MAG: hypothetical protein GYA21_15875 [Myxococcales bacterium]|nr:hypothetical protein [Myxococcales bacterium]